MRVLISGAGVAGLTLAHWLHRQGDTPVLVEQAPTARRAGFGVDFGGTGYDVASRMGIAEQLSARQLPVDSVHFVNNHGRARATMTKALIDTVSRGPHLALMHGTLEEVLADAVAPNVEIRYGRSVTQLQQSPGSVTATMSDGSRDSFDLVVGADGVHSHTREMVFGPETDFAYRLGYRVACHPVTDNFGLGRVRTHYTEPGRQLILYPSGEPGELIALYLFRTDDSINVARDRRVELLREVFGGMGWLAPKVLTQLRDTSPVFMDTLTQIDMPTWHDRRVALIGDACGCTTLASAQGVSMAMGGAYLLARQLRANPNDHRVAFAAFEETLKPQVRHRQANARRFARGLVPATRAGITAQNIVSRIIMRHAFAGLLRTQFGAATILPDSEMEPQL